MADSMFASSVDPPGRYSTDEVALKLGKPWQAFRKRSFVSESGGVATSDAPRALRTRLGKLPQAARPIYWSQTVLDLVLKSVARLKGSGNEDPSRTTTRWKAGPGIGAS